MDPLSDCTQDSIHSGEFFFLSAFLCFFLRFGSLLRGKLGQKAEYSTKQQTPSGFPENFRNLKVLGTLWFPCSGLPETLVKATARPSLYHPEVLAARRRPCSLPLSARGWPRARDGGSLVGKPSHPTVG